MLKQGEGVTFMLIIQYAKSTLLDRVQVVFMATNIILRENVDFLPRYLQQLTRSWPFTLPRLVDAHSGSQEGQHRGQPEGCCCDAQRPY